MNTKWGEEQGEGARFSKYYLKERRK